MSKEQVIDSEQRDPDDQQENIMYYKTSVAGDNMALLYFFTNDELTKARYGLNEKHSNKNDFISDYENLKELLEKKYGTPALDRIVWKNDLYKDCLNSQLMNA